MKAIAERVQALLREYEWSDLRLGCTVYRFTQPASWQCCPVCRGVRPHEEQPEYHFPANHIGHRADCSVQRDLKAVTAMLADLSL